MHRFADNRSRKLGLTLGHSRIGLFLPVVLVTQAASREGDEQQRQRPKAEQETVGHVGRGEKDA